MHSAKNYLIVFLVATTVTGGAVAWRQYQELIALRAAALNPNERADWQKRLWDAEKRRSELETKLATKVENPEPGDAPPETRSENGPPQFRTRNGRAEMRNDFAAMMDRPEIQRLMALQQKAALDSKYASLFKSLNLTPEQLEKFKNLLVEKNTAVMDVLAAAREQGTNPRTDRDTFRKLVADAQADVDASIRTTLGETAYSQYKEYEQTQPQRAVVDQLTQRLSYSTTPLTADQSAQLVKILETTAEVKNGGGNRVFVGGPGMGPVNFSSAGSVQVTDASINQALGVLAAPQVEALKQLQQEQQAQAQLNAAMRKQFQESRASGTTSGSTTVTTPPVAKSPGGG